ncbi:uncharacterized protein Dsimw501_GD28930 [Drosophila simulans]|nr:uncharacterized protein Dsimw501_GD28930 [Drosophila simulans]
MQRMQQDLPQDMTLHKVSSDRRSLHKPHPAQLLFKRQRPIVWMLPNVLEIVTNPRIPAKLSCSSCPAGSCDPVALPSPAPQSSRPCRGRCNPLTVPQSQNKHRDILPSVVRRPSVR